MTSDRLPLELALTIRHDGNGGVADDLDSPEGLTAWIGEHRAALGAEPFRADAAALAAVRELRAAVRSLFAHAVRPGPPSAADAHRLIPVAEAVGRLNAAAALMPVVPRLEWPDGGVPGARSAPAGSGTTGTGWLVATLAREAIAFLAGPERERLRACQGPRCVRYFVKDHPRQEWCGPPCGNRARVARHQRRNRRIRVDR